MGARTNDDANASKLNRGIAAIAIAALVALWRERQFSKNRRAMGH